ncbi:MAG: DNA gyrase inhibitor YacG [Planctomycetes bacterium]|nr:DNA gyrase inhibitor YacG [Planctomycetota bacterium]
MHDAPDVRCPTCGKPVQLGSESFPFCCRRCRLIDLGAWIDGRHAIPGRTAPGDAQEEER